MGFLIVEVIVFFILLPEFFDLVGFPGKGSDQPDAGNIFLGGCIEHGGLITDFVIDFI